MKKRFLKKIKTKIYDAEKEKEALDQLMHWYREQGFWDARILQCKHIPIKDNFYKLEVVLDEGVQRFVKYVEVVGHPKITRHEIFARINNNKYKKIPFALSLLAQQKIHLAKIFKACGFLHVAIEHVLQEQKNGLHLLWKIVPGEQVHFGNTTIRGYTKVPKDLLRKQLDYIIGDVWNKDKLQNTLIHFRSLDLFERVHIQPLHDTSKNNQRDVLVTVQEDDPFEVKLRMGYQQMSKNFAFKKGSSYRAGIICLWKNPFKKADTFLLDLHFTRFDRLISGAYKIPFFLHLPFMTTFKGYAKKYTQPVSVGSKKTLYETNQEGFSMGFSSHKKNIDTGCTVGFEWVKTKNVSVELAKALRFEADLVDKRIPYFFIQPTLFLDLLDDKLNPNKGMFGLVSLKAIVPFGDSSYIVKFLVEEGLFIPMGPLVFASRVRFGHIFRKNFAAIMPPERFYLGGANSLRGYQTDKCPPLGSFVDEMGTTQWVAHGGKTMVNINLEMRIPLHKRTFYGVLFQDFGALEEDVLPQVHL